jgi:hypothetical protein
MNNADGLPSYRTGETYRIYYSAEFPRGLHCYPVSMLVDAQIVETDYLVVSNARILSCAVQRDTDYPLSRVAGCPDLLPP